MLLPCQPVWLFKKFDYWFLHFWQEFQRLDWSKIIIQLLYGRLVATKKQNNTKKRTHVSSTADARGIVMDCVSFNFRFGFILGLTQGNSLHIAPVIAVICEVRQGPVLLYSSFTGGESIEISC